MPRFQQGEFIISRVTDANKKIFAGARYQVKAIFGEWMCLDHYPHSAHHVNDFNKVDNMTIEINSKAKSKKTDKTQANVFYVRRVGTVTEKVVHKTFEDARNEANRLAELTPNHEFQVLAVAYTVKKVPVYTTESHEYGV